MKMSHYLLMLFQTHVTLFFPWSTKSGIMKVCKIQTEVRMDPFYDAFMVFFPLLKL